MSSPSEALPISPTYAWQSNPQIIMAAPRGDAIPSWWTGNRPTWVYSLLSWFVTQEAQGNKATNSRVQMKDLRVYYLSQSTKKWSQLDIKSAPDVEMYVSPFSYYGPSGRRLEGSGGISVKPKYPYFHHGYGNTKSINPQDIRAIYAAMDFRLAVDDASKPDDRASAKYVVTTGADYWPGQGVTWSLGYAPGVGTGRLLLATQNWRTATLLVPNPNYGATMAEMKTNPPPLSTLSTPAPTPTPTPAPTSGTKALTAKHSGKCLDVSGLSTLNGAPVIQWSCNGGANQQWTLKDTGNAKYQIVSKSSGKCLDVTNGSTADGTALQQNTCAVTPKQLWTLQSAGTGYNKVVSAVSGKCLDVTAASTADNAQVIQWACNGGDNQSWMIK